ncbi:dihydroorotate dehydrogenase [Psychroflexus salis]|uniref:Dihydroorotate dehydrogenase n=2 Tax=Psychroflexus salis TaxID=1526574 RepID=A0A916ZXS1_9FLAO|nr:dihydroorotate dehydrogenase [Psychroflexus salis]
MPDSRRYALKFLVKLNNKIYKRINWQSRLTMFVVSLLIGFAGVYLLKDDSFTDPQTNVMFILFFAIALWVTEAIPPFAVGILIVGYLVFSLGYQEAEDVKQYVDTWSDSVIWLFLGGFFLAEGMKKTKLDAALLRITVPKLGNQSKYILLGLMMITGILSMLMSNTATTAMMIATISPILTQFGKSAPITKSLLIGIPTAAAIGGMGTIIGSAPNAIAVGALEGIGISISFIEWMLIGVPVSLLLIFIFWKALLLKYTFKAKTLSLDFLSNEQTKIDDEDDHGEAQHQKKQQRIMLVILGITLFFWLSSQWTGIPVAMVSGIPIVGLTMLGIVDSDEVRQLPWDTLMLVAGGLALGLAVQQYGLADYFISLVAFENINIYVMYLVFGLITVILSNIMSNTATATIMIPISISLVQLNQLGRPSVMVFIIALSASCALLLPVSTPPNAISFSTGMLEQKEFRYGGVLLGILGPILVILFVLLTAPLIY